MSMDASALGKPGTGAHRDLRPITATEVALHNKPSDIWVIIHGLVYDVTDFLPKHPGGIPPLAKNGRAGQDVTSAFERLKHSADARALLPAMAVGRLAPATWERDATWRRRRHPASASTGAAMVAGGGTATAADAGGGGERGTAGNARAAKMTAGFHHLALVTADLKETVRFHEEALGMKLRAIFPLHGIPGGKHAFLEAGNGNEISFMQFGAPAAGAPGTSWPAYEQGECPVATQHHLAYAASSLAHLRALRRQVIAAFKHGNFAWRGGEGSDEGDAPHDRVSPVIDHGFCYSARQDSAEDFSRLNVPRCAAMGWILIPVHCSANS